ncbi:MAG: glycogen/starch/alpha-glucan family phosphorylase, partial [Spirochaetales bacterium]|nr:glycogen/starch/alpha-glucan family phosphorylase [Spirochaetales bacterium]
RHMQIIYEINSRFIQKAAAYFPLQTDKIARVSIIEESNPKMVRMANLAIIGSHSTNGVAALHSDLLKTSMFPEFNQIFPERFNNKTNGITQRRWLLDANPRLAGKITEAIGDGWITDFSKIADLRPFADDAGFRADFAKIKEQTKLTAADFLKRDCGIIVDPSTLFDVQVKRIHEYKRQLMNALNIIMIYDRMKNDEAFRTSFPPTTFLFGGKAAPGYINAKLIIKFINNIARVINSDPQVNRIINVFFMPNYRVTMAERVIPATNISEQISTAGLEASGTGNMKFMINGALTMGTLDGANVEIAEEAGADNCFIFGHTESQIAALSRDYDPEEWIMADEGIRRAVELVESRYFNLTEPGIFEPLIKSLTEYGDRYKIFADLRMYHDRHNEATDLYRNSFDDWNRKAIINIASSGKFSSDRTIQQYADEIWNIKPCKVKKSTKDSVLQDAYNPKAAR